MFLKYPLIVAIFAITLLSLPACKKSAPPAESQPAAATEEQSTPKTAAETNDSPAAKDVVNAPNHAKVAAPDFKSSSVPEIVTTDDVTTVSWGKKIKRSVNWLDDIEISYEIPVLNGDSIAIQKINAFAQKQSESFFTKDNLSPCWEYEQQRHAEQLEVKPFEETYENNYSLDVDISDKYISIIHLYTWYMGGVNDYGIVPHVFDAQTGDKLSLMQVTGKSIEDLRKLVSDAIKEKYEEADSDIEWDKIQKAEHFNFYIQENQIHVVFVKYEIASGAAGGFDLTIPVNIVNPST